MANRKKIRDDNPEWTEADFKRAKSGNEIFGELGIPVPPKRGRPPADVTKKQVTLRLDADIIEHFKSDGPGWQTRINEALSISVAAKKKNLRRKTSA
ncbi:MAG: BrnA antitoxin family protein [Pseudomonadota bacterium]